MHKAGVVNIIGLPNAGKSTLLNVFTGENLSIVTPKPQTTRHRLKAIVSAEDYQVIFFDTPGVVKPEYELHKLMMKNVAEATKDTDVILLLADVRSRPDDHEIVKDYLVASKKPLVVVINKTDLEKLSETKRNLWQQAFQPKEIITISAKEGKGVDELLKSLLTYLPEHPAYYDKDEITDRPLRFFVQEIIREQVFLQFREEIPYSTEVQVEEFKELEHITRIRAFIICERESQKAILLGHKGAAIKDLGIKSRERIEAFIEQKVYLELSIKVRKDWRDDTVSLNRYGY